MMDEDDFRFPTGPSGGTEPPKPGQAGRAGGKLQERATGLADELRAHARVEAAQGQLSPMDNALMLRIEAFLRHEVGRA